MFCIIGAGLSGDTAAATLRAEGYPGAITLIGDEVPPPYDRPPLSKEVLFDDLPEDRVFLRAAGWYNEQNITLKLGAAVIAIDRAARSLTLSTGETLAYDKLLIATGARARRLPGAEAAGIPTFVVRTLDDARGLKMALFPGQRIAIIGAGVIGLEVAASARQRGCSVDVIECADRVLSRVVPPALSAHMAGLHQRNGTRLHLSAGAVSIMPGGVRSEAHGDIPADAIVIGVGVVPNIELAASAGLDCRDGILVDAVAQTSDPDIFATGDVARYPDPFGTAMIRCENWKHAQNHAMTAARAMLGMRQPYAAASGMWSDQFDMKLQTVGVLEGEEILRGQFGGSKFLILYCDMAGILVGAAGINSAKDIRFAQMLIEKRAIIDRAMLADPKQDLRKLAA